MPEADAALTPYSLPPMHLQLISFDDKAITEFLEELGLRCRKIRDVYPDSIRKVIRR